MTSAEALTAPDELDRLLGKLTLQQKIRLLSGDGTFRTPAEPAIGLRAMVFSDGPVGVRGEHWDERDTALALPSPTALAATWDDGLVRRLGGLLAAEARRKGVDVLLAPTLNLHRSPAAGRHFECFSEDPLLTARMGAALIGGVQDGGVAATAKHYTVNDSETERLTLDARIDPSTLHAVYLAPFEAAVAAGVWVVMAAYNRVNGVAMTESPLLTDPLKDSWGFDGVVVSDWGAVTSTVASARAALDLAMPGPHPAWGEALLRAVQDGRVPQAVIDAKVRRILLLAARVGALGAGSSAAPPPAPAPHTARALLRHAVAAGTVLLRNEGSLLPLDATGLRRVAVLGPNAATARVQGGGSAGVFTGHCVSPLAGIRRALPARVEVVHAPGPVPYARPAPLHTGNARDPLTGEPGVRLRYLDATGAQVHTEHRLSGRILEPVAPGADLTGATAVEVTALVTPDTTGPWRLGVVGLGQVVLEADGRRLIDEHVAPESADPTYLHVAPSYRTAAWEAEAGRELTVRAQRQLEPGTGQVIALTADPPPADDQTALAHAVGLARTADVAIVVVGTTDEIESEGFDRTTLALPGSQDELVTAVAAANPRTVVIVNSGGPVELPWHEEIPALLLGWFPGQEAGDGLADVLLGAAEPGGRLPTTWAVRTEDVPVLDTAPVDAVLAYTEGPYIGYRAWRRTGRRPAYWFGHGLGYTTWAYESLTADGPVHPELGLTVRVRVRNTGPRAGREVVQIYVSEDGGPDPADRRLAGYARVRAEPGERVTVPVRLPARAFRRWSPQTRRRHVEPGGFHIHAGPSVADTPLREHCEGGPT
ncbi:MAG: beta-glucosidase [Streptomyces sp.]|nr:beta-glucosidase [Streptomyces sp.]